MKEVLSMAKKKVFALRLTPETWDAIEKWAADDFRSVNGQIEWIIHNALKNAGRIKYSDQQPKEKQ